MFPTPKLALILGMLSFSNASSRFDKLTCVDVWIELCLLEFNEPPLVRVGRADGLVGDRVSEDRDRLGGLRETRILVFVAAGGKGWRMFRSPACDDGCEGQEVTALVGADGCNESGRIRLGIRDTFTAGKPAGKAVGSFAFEGESSSMVSSDKLAIENL
jgi:hypothetical protein